MTWTVTRLGKAPKLKKPILLEGLPGIGNTGKVAVDFLVEELKAEKLFEFTSCSFPHSVFVNEKNLVELPTIALYYKQMRGRDLLFLVGDIQPIDEVSCYAFCEMLLELLTELGCEELITLGGIGLQQIPKNPQVFITGASKKYVDEFRKGLGLSTKLYGIVGPIVGVTGVLLGVSPRYRIKSVGLLVETFGHPMYLGVKGAKELLAILKKKLGLKINLKKMVEEIEELEKEVMRKTKELSDVGKQNPIKKLKEGRELSYIG